MITLDRAGGLWLARIDRPDKANALTARMLHDLADIAAAAGREAQGLILTGAGDTVFSAGADLGEARAGLATDPVWERLSGALAACPIPTVAALNGTLAGGAFGMALACDFRVAVPGATFFYPVAKLGFLPQPSDPVRLAALIGPARAKMILLAGQRIDATEALHWGLIDRVATGDVVAAATELLSVSIDTDRAHLAAIKAMIDG
ncbi:MAG: enoyl-CoA hydratase/isomerase family protein [Pseudomonadota bacterium]